MNKTIVTIIALFSLFACARPPVTVTRPEDSLTHLSSWKSVAPRDDREFKDIAAAARQSLEYYKKLPQDTVFFLGPDKVSARDMAVTLQNFLLIVENDSFTYDQKVEQIKNDFMLYRSVGSDGQRQGALHRLL